MSGAKTKRDLTQGPLFGPIFFFVVPIILTGMLQIMYNMADNIVVGRFSGDDLALAAVGSTSSLSNLIVNLLMGIAGGSGVVVAQSYGAKDRKGLTEAIGNCIALSVIASIVIMIIGPIISMPMHAEGNSRMKSFLIGTLSGVVEPIGAVAILLLAGILGVALPYLLAFAAGAMMYVVVEELIPETAQGAHTNLSTIGFAIGFVLMMVMDVVLG